MKEQFFMLVGKKPPKIETFHLQPHESQPGDEIKEQEEKKDEEKPVVQPFQQLYVTSPDGLSLKYSLESSIGTEVNLFIAYLPP